MMADEQFNSSVYTQNICPLDGGKHVFIGYCMFINCKMRLNWINHRLIKRFTLVCTQSHTIEVQ